MKSKFLSENVKKNLLDLQYSKNLYYFNTCIIILFTYLTGITIAFVTKQINYTNIGQMLSTGLVSIVVIGILVLKMITLKIHLKKIPEIIKELKL